MLSEERSHYAFMVRRKEEWAHRKPVRTSGELTVALVDTEFNFVLLEKSRFIAVTDPHQYSIQNTLYSPGRICVCGAQDG